jgi:hydrogenase expression/formation protein HypE
MARHDPQNPSRLLKAGKLPHADLRRLLGTLGNNDPRVLLGPDIGRDAALISFGSTTLIAKTDPVTFATSDIGWYAVQVNANDIAVSGGTPKWFLATVLLPEGESLATAEKIFGQLKSAADSLDIALVGGHTEITIGLPRPIVVGMMLGEAPPSETISAAGAQVGDSVILSRGIAIEGTAILATELRDRLVKLGVTPATLDSAAGFIRDPGI